MRGIRRRKLNWRGASHSRGAAGSVSQARSDDRSIPPPPPAAQEKQHAHVSFHADTYPLAEPLVKSPGISVKIAPRIPRLPLERLLPQPAGDRCLEREQAVPVEPASVGVQEPAWRPAVFTRENAAMETLQASLRHCQTALSYEPAAFGTPAPKPVQAVQVSTPVEAARSLQREMAEVLRHGLIPVSCQTQPPTQPPAEHHPQGSYQPYTTANCHTPPTIQGSKCAGGAVFPGGMVSSMNRAAYLPLFQQKALASEGTVNPNPVTVLCSIPPKSPTKAQNFAAYPLGSSPYMPRESHLNPVPPPPAAPTNPAINVQPSQGVKVPALNMQALAKQTAQHSGSEPLPTALRLAQEEVAPPIHVHIW